MAASVWMNRWNCLGSGDIPAGGADDARRHRGLQPKRRADGHRPVAHVHAVRVADGDRLQVVAVVDLHHRHVGFHVVSDYLGRVLVLGSSELHLDMVGLVDNVIVGEDVAVSVDDKARAATLAAVLAPWAIVGRLREEAAEHVGDALFVRVVLRTGMLGRVVGGNKHHRWLQLLRQPGEFVLRLSGWAAVSAAWRPGATVCVPEALTAVLINVPITIPIESVSTSRLMDRSLSLRSYAHKLMVLFLPGKLAS